MAYKHANENWEAAEAFFHDKDPIRTIVHYRAPWRDNTPNAYVLWEKNFTEQVSYYDISRRATFAFCKKQTNSNYHYVTLRPIADLTTDANDIILAFHPTMKPKKGWSANNHKFIDCIFTNEEAEAERVSLQEEKRLRSLANKKSAAAKAAFEGITFENGWFAGMVGRTQWGNPRGRFTRQVMDGLVQLFVDQNLDYDNLSRSNADWSFLHDIGLDVRWWKVGSEGFQTNFFIRDGHKFQAHFLPEAVPYQQKWEADPAYKLDCGEAERSYPIGSVEQMLEHHAEGVVGGEWGDFLYTLYSQEGKTYWDE